MAAAASKKQQQKPMSSESDFSFRIQEKIERDESSKLHVIIAGAGLAGLGAAISILLAGHSVTVLEAVSAVSEIGAGIQILPNAARVLFSWDLHHQLKNLTTCPVRCNFWGWRGNFLSEMDFKGYERANTAGAPFWDFHRADLHGVLFRRVEELGADIRTRARVVGFECLDDDGDDDEKVEGEGERVRGRKREGEGEEGQRVKKGGVKVHLADGRTMEADLLVGADGIHSHLREVFLGRPDPPTPTGDIAYRLLLKTKDMLTDPTLRSFVVGDPEVNYWLGPDVHAVNYILRGGEQLNMVLLVPDDIPADEAGKTVVVGDAASMRAHLRGWDERLDKLAALLCEDDDDDEANDVLLKWRLCIRPGLDPSWSHPSGCFTMLGDAVHATLPYLASGAGMALEDAGVLGLCLGRITDKSARSKRLALKVYEACRRERTEHVVKRGSYNQYIYHLHDGPEQEARDERFRMYGEWEKQWLSAEHGHPVLPKVNETGDDPFPWRYHGVARWLLTYDMWQDVDEKWAAVTGASDDVAAAATPEEAGVEAHVEHGLVQAMASL